MNWWKKAKIETLEDRNHINERIMKLEVLSEVLRYAAKLVFQTARGARKMVQDIAKNKTVDPYEDIKLSLAAADKCAMDSPKKFALFCNEAASIIAGKISDLEDMRSEFTEETLPHRMKGLVDES